MQTATLKAENTIRFSYSKTTLVLTILSILLIIVAIWAVGVGSLPISFRDVCAILAQEIGIGKANVEEQQQVILTVIRLPRVLMGILVGAVLGMTGASMQGLFRNPLADPGLIGISSGASLFAVMMVVLELKFFAGMPFVNGLYGMAIASFAGAALATLCVYQLSKLGGKVIVSTMLLAGIAVNAFAGAITGFLTFIATDAQLRTIQFWSLGSLGGATWEAVKVAATLIAIPVLLVPRLSKELNAFALGESQAEYLGIHAGRLKTKVILLTTLGVGASVAMCGTIGFIGLIIPHTIRLFGGADHRLVLPASGLLGATVLTLADLISRTVMAPAEIPIGIVTALIGTPVFVWILMKNQSSI
ncbi:MAG: iron ABC transporter permease [Siphonobacter sp.]